MQVTPYPIDSNNQWQFGMTPVPTSAVTVYPRTTKLIKMWFSNTTGAAATLTVTDASTEAAGQPCQVFPAVPIPANSADFVNFNGVTANGGVQWFASAAGVQAHIVGAS